MNRALVIAVLALFLAATPVWSQPSPDFATLLLRSMEAQAVNGAALLQHSWTQSTEIVVDGDSKGVIFHLVRFDLDHQMQRTTLGVQEEGRLRLRPFDRRRKLVVGAVRRLVGAVVDAKVGAIMQTIAGAGGLVAGYGRPGAPFYESASYVEGSGEMDQTFKAFGTDVLKPGDALSMWLDEVTGLPRRVEFESYLEEPEEEVRAIIEYETFNGLTYAARTTIDVPHEQLQIIIEAFDHTAQRFAPPPNAVADPSLVYPDPARLARLVSNSQEQNLRALNAYTRVVRVEAREDDETEMVRLYDIDPVGTDSVTLIGGEWDEGSRNRGLMGRRSRRRADARVEDVEEITRTVATYVLAPSERLHSFYQAGSFQHGTGDLAHTLRITGTGYLRPEDSVTAWFDPTTGTPVRILFRTTLQDDDDVIEGVIEYVSLQDGPFVPARITVTGPGEDETMIIEAFDFELSGL